ncbi:threonine synthase [Marinobacter nanhaiticus D15-8W]|uniref:Threonine synthase n=1 Tax=Marinobacter nanhaiticus D15-8W TaxID=626887 RepID=N6WZU1_9GAMM|nr:threonine synthase [Marinobacter nanhaiticus]ENO16697.1 threonine synthase [Marinobacter nanhaiticus D15-8W]BES72499.1 threonine synthase [Marinobacter nanhaiticus D15-8W]
MRYISTRGDAPSLGFEDVLLTGLATDGGLYVPESLPKFSLEEIRSWRGLSYAELAFKVMHPFVDDAIPADDFRAMLDETYNQFAHKAVAPLVQLDSNEWVMELFRGPTLAFKDFALQLLGRLLDYVLEKRKQHVVIMGATSGDTGSAAIEGCRHCEHVDIFILHPHERVSEVQRRQMTTVIGDNVHNIAVKGNFDDCQRMVKASFGDQSFLKGETQLVAVNSINWARIMAQIVYYFQASLALGGPDRSMAFSVPTGNFGDIFAGYLAREMGLPISQLVIATNRNDILHRFMSGNRYEKQQLEHTLSPSMDIMVSSNFERLLFDLHGRDGAAVRDLLERAQTEAVSIEDYRWKSARKLFDSDAVDDATTCEIIREVFDQNEYLLDPHTAIGVRAARNCRRDDSVPMITLGTAHPAKFPDAVKQSGMGVKPELPHHLADLFEREERYTVLDDDLKSVQDFIASHWKSA